MSISLSDLGKYLGIGNPILGCIAAALVVVTVCGWITNSWAFANYMDRDYRVIKRVGELKKLKPDDNSSGIFVREISLLEQKLRIRYSRRQFGGYLRMRFSDEAADAAMEKRSNPYHLRGMASILYYAVQSFCYPFILILFIILAFICWRFASGYYDKTPAMPGILGKLWGLAKLVRKAPAERLRFSLLVAFLLLIVIGFTLLMLIEWCWNRYLCGYAFKRYIRPSLEKETRDILAYGSARFHDPGYPKVVETFRNELAKLGNRQTIGPQVAGVFIGVSFPAAFLSGILQGLENWWPAQKTVFSVTADTIMIVVPVVFTIGICMTGYLIFNMHKILPNSPIKQSDAPK